MERIEIDLMTSLKTVTFKEKAEPAFHNSHPFPFDPGTDVTSEELDNLESYLNLDYDRMVSSVEDAIMEDKSRNRHRVTPKELLVKSNPSLYADVNKNHQMNNMLSNRRWVVDSHSKDDSHVKPMANLVAPGPSFPFLSRTSSMNNINHYTGGKMLRKQHSHSNQDLSVLDRKDHGKYSTALHRHQNYSMDDLRHVTESDKENRKALYFPAIRRERTKTMAPSSFPGSDSSGVSFPNVRSDLSGPLQNGSHGEVRVNQFTRDKTRVSGKPFVHKLEKWFSEIPREEFEKADHTRLMENSDSSKSSLQKEKQKNRNQWKVPVLRPMQNIPNKYLELKNELNSNGTVNKETNINRDQYKLRQKSLLQLKMNGVEDRERSKTNYDFDHDSRQYTFHTDRFSSTEHQHPHQTLEDLARARKHIGDGVKRIDIGEFAIDAYNIKPNSKFNFAHLDSTGIAGSVNEHSNSGSISSNDSEVQRTPERGDPSKTAIVNLEISRSRGSRSNKHKPGHFENNSNSNTSMSMTNPKRLGHSAAVNGSTDNSAYNPNQARGYIRSKTVLSKFNTLEVFGNDPKSQQLHECSDQRKFLGSMLRVEENGGSKKPTKVPVYKLDLKTITKKSLRQKPVNSEEARAVSDNILQEIPTLSLEFGTGEVVINRKSGVEFNRKSDAEVSPNTRNKQQKRYPVQSPQIMNDTPPELVDRAAGSTYNPDRLDVVSNGTLAITPDLKTNDCNTQEQLRANDIESDAQIDPKQKAEVKDEESVNDHSHTENVTDCSKENENGTVNAQEESIPDENQHETTDTTEISQQPLEEAVVQENVQQTEGVVLDSKECEPEQKSSEEIHEEKVSDESEQQKLEGIDVADTGGNEESQDNETAEEIIEKRDAATSVSTIHKTPRLPTDTPVDPGETPEINYSQDDCNEGKTIQEEVNENTDSSDVAKNE